MPHLAFVTRSWCRTGALLVCCLAAPHAHADQLPPVAISVFVGAPLRDGFIDTTKDVQDSIADLSKRLRDVKGLKLVTRQAGPAVTVTIVTRGVGSEPWGQRLNYQEFFRGAELSSTPIALTTWWVTAVLDVNASQYRKEFVGAYTHPPGLGYYGGAWTECAKRLADNVTTWIDANRGRLVTPRPLN